MFTQIWETSPSTAIEITCICSNSADVKYNVVTDANIDIIANITGRAQNVKWNVDSIMATKLTPNVYGIATDLRHLINTFSS